MLIELDPVSLDPKLDGMLKVSVALNILLDWRNNGLITKLTVLEKEDGSISRNQKEILKLQANFYERLYTTEPEISFCFVNNSDCKLMPEEEKETNKELELEELTIVLK